MSQRAAYLFAQEQVRERATVERLLLSQGGAGIAGGVLASQLRWQGCFSWYAVRVPTERVLPAGVDPSQFPGDIDLMGGPLSWDAAALARVTTELGTRYPGLHPSHWEHIALRGAGSESVVTWPPPLDFISAAEVKSAFVDAAGVLRGFRGGLVDRARRQAGGLTRMGFDRAALLWLAVTEPVRSSEEVNPWMLAGSRAIDGISQLRRKLEAHADGTGYGEIILSAGAVPGGLEHMRGTQTGDIHRVALDRQRIAGSESALVRASIEAAITEAFNQYDRCPSLPVVIRACTRSTCQSLFVASPPELPVCPRCDARSH